MSVDPRKKKHKRKAGPKRRHGRISGLEILHEDRDLIVVGKASGLLTIASDRNRTCTAYYLLTDYVRKGAVKSRERVFIVHRLDRETSGVLVFARTPFAKRYLQDHWEATEKEYVAVVHGHLNEPEGEIQSYLAENAAHRVYTTRNSKEGRFARTGYRVRHTVGANSVLDLQLHTGRKHQIRVHLADMGHPIVGDQKYGKPEDRKKPLALHAHKLTLTHPHTRERMTFVAAEPERLLRWLPRESW